MTFKRYGIMISIFIASLFSLSTAYAQQTYGNPLTTTIWNDTDISVCWENFNDSTAQQRLWVRNAVEGTWSAVSSVRFTGWAQCGNADIRIRVADAGPHVIALGSLLQNRTNGMLLNFTYQNWSPSCQGDEQRCSEVIAIHEFGHALGFAHEHNRSDTPTDICTDDPQGTDGNLQFGAWDLDSVMNYCNPNWNGDGELSDTDIRMVQAFYSSVYEGFENSSLDLWRQSDQDSIDWLVRQGGTPSSSTGPSAASIGDSYAYMETSSGHAYYNGDDTWLTSSFMTGSNRQIAFDYHMYGSNMGSLELDVYYGGRWYNNIWSAVGQQQTSSADDWQRAYVDLSAYTGTIKLRLRGVAAGGYRGDIAIDNLAIYGDDVDVPTAYSRLLRFSGEDAPYEQDYLTLQPGVYTMELYDGGKDGPMPSEEAADDSTFMVYDSVNRKVLGDLNITYDDPYYRTTASFTITEPVDVSISLMASGRIGLTNARISARLVHTQ